MLKIHIDSEQFFDEKTYSFFTIPETTLKLEHSLVSVSKWESKYRKPFLTDAVKTREETLYYIQCMTLNNNVDERIYEIIPDTEIIRVNEYIETSQTASWINHNNDSSHKSNEQTTSELLYFYMIDNNIPPEYQKWHLSRLLTLLEICNVKRSPSKKMSEQETLQRYAEINKQRRAAMKNKG